MRPKLEEFSVRAIGSKIAMLALALSGLMVPGTLVAQFAGRNVNMVSGTQWPGGDPFLQRQNEPSLAISTRNPLHLLAGANDYRTVDLPGLAAGETGDAWVSLFKSFDGGLTWTSTLLPGYPQDTSPDGSASAMKGFQAGADPVVRAGTNGLFYYSGLAFNRGSNAASAIVVSRFLDNNNNEAGDTIQFLGASRAAQGTSQTFLDKPWMAVDIPRAGALNCQVGNPAQSIPGGNVYIVYTAFAGDQSHGAIMFSGSRDCGASWSTPLQIAPSTSTNQGATIAINPVNGAVYVAWRRFASATDLDAIMFSKSTDGGQTFSPPSVGSLIVPFDQSTSAVSFRTNAYPTMAVDGNGLIYLGWSQRGVGPGGDARIVISTSTTGTAWTAPVPIDNPPVRGHQIMPALSCAAGRLAVVYYDLRDDTTTGIYAPLGGGQFTETRLPIGDLAAPAQPQKVFTTGIVDASPSAALGTLQRRHTMDVRVAEANVGAGLLFTSTKVSQYPIGSRPGQSTVEQMQTNPPNLPMFAIGTVPFMGDYLDLAALAFVKDSNGNWIFNTAASNSTVFHAVWADNRDVRPPADGNWAHYTPPTSASTQATSIFDPNQAQPPCQLGLSGSRNQNIYTARITQGLLANSPGNSKPLSLLIPRAFVISVQNTTSVAKTYRLVIANQPPGGRASFSQRSTSSSILKVDVTIPALSSIARTVFVVSTVAQAQVRVDVVEITGPNGTVIPSGLQSSVLLNPDPTNPANPDISNAEVYNPDISNPDISNPDISNPDISNPDISNPDISNVVVENPDISNPDISNPDISNPDISNPDISNPDISNPDISNGAFKDVTWVVTNKGNTFSSYTVKTVLASSFPTGFKQQLIIRRVYATPIASNCAITLQLATEVLTNIVNPVFSSAADVANPDISNAAINNATVALGPNQTARITMRVVNPDRTTNTTFDPAKALVAAATSHAVDTSDLAKGINQPPVASSALLILPASLPSGQVGTAYPATTLLSAGGTAPIAWSLVPGNFLPGGLTINTAGTISGLPSTAGTFTFNVAAADSGIPQQVYVQSFTIVIAAQKPLVITSTGVPNGYVGLAYNYTLTATGGLGNRTWTVTAGTLPPGVTLSTAGTLTGMPVALGSSTFTVTVTDSSPIPLSTPRAFTLQVIPLGLAFVAQPGNTRTGQSIPVQVKVQDGFGNPVAGLPVTLTIGTGGASVYDAVLDYSNSANPNGPWRYGSMPNIGGSSFSPFANSLPGTTCTSPAGGECWTNALASPNTASVVHNLTPNSLLYSGSILQPPNVLNLLAQNTFPAVRWVAPSTDSYTVSGQFTRIDTAPSPTNVRVLQDNTTTLFGVDNFNTPSAPQPFVLPNLHLNAGAALDFFAGANAGPAHDSTGLQVTITGSGPSLNGLTTSTTGANGIAVFNNISIPTPGTFKLKASQPLASSALSTTFTISSAASCAPPPSGLISWWPAEGSATDVVGGNNGTITGADGSVFYGPAQVGQGFLITNPSFDANPAFVSVPNASNLSLSTVTLEGWIKMNSMPAVASNFVVALKGALFENYGLYLTSAGELSFQWYDGSGFPEVDSTGAGLVAGTVYHIAVTSDGSTIKFYVNGALVSQAPQPSALTPNTEVLQIGADPPFGNNFDGFIDELTIYNRALLPAEVQTIFNAGSAGKCR
jgi:hypothetical protein